MMKLYELNCSIKPNELEVFEGKIRNLIEKENGIIVDIKNPARKKSIYLKKARTENSAYLISLNFNLEPDKLRGLKENLSQDTQILRYLILNERVPKLIEKRRVSPLPSFKGIEETKRKKVELKEIGEKLEEMLGK